VEHSAHRIGRRLAALGVVAALLAACNSSTGTFPPASKGPVVVVPPSGAPVSEPSVSLASIEASVAYVQTQGTFVTVDGTQEQIYSGSGFVIDPSGLIVTNNHVVTGGAFWKVAIGASTTLLDAQLVGVSECSDLAVLKVSGTYPALTMSATDPTVGEPIYVAGHPLGADYTLTNGIVAKAPAPDDTSWASVQDEIQITAQTYPGSSGSPVVDAAGHVIGVEYAGGVAGSLNAGQSFAIGASEAKSIVDQIKTSGNLDYVGLNGEANADGSGIAIISVAPGSPADKAGIEAGDLLTNFNGTAVGTDGTKATYCSVLRSHKSSDTFSVTLSRGGQTCSGEINGKPITCSASGSAAIDQLKPYVPANIWSTCSLPSEPSSALVSALCSYSAAGVDTVGYSLYGSAADLKAAYDGDVGYYNAQPATSTLTCANGNVNGTWKWAGGASDPDKGLLCYKDSAGYAYIEQADPAIDVLFIAALKSGDQAALYNWWLNNTTLVDPSS
jgi:S1-C subfamily serine protease